MTQETADRRLHRMLFGPTEATMTPAEMEDAYFDLVEAVSQAGVTGQRWGADLQYETGQVRLVLADCDVRRVAALIRRGTEIGP